MEWWNRLFAKTGANPEKSMMGCLVANALLVALGFLFFWLAGVPIRWFQ